MLFQVVEILLDAIRPDATLSLPPLFDLLVAAARDLQGEFAAHLPAVWDRWDKSSWAYVCSMLESAAVSTPQLNIPSESRYLSVVTVECSMNTAYIVVLKGSEGLYSRVCLLALAVCKAVRASTIEQRF